MAPPVSAKIKYRCCSDKELATFITARGVEVETIPPNTTDRDLRRYRKDRIYALEQSDAHLKPFRFLDLHAELRTAVYENLLVFDNSFTCHPQILATSKAINEEASNILYGDNLIEVKLWNDGPHVHGKLVEREWSTFLSRVQFLQVSYGPERSIEHTPEFEFSELCETLMNRHRLRSIKVSFAHAAATADLPDFDEPFEVYPLRMLGALQECVVEGVNGAILDHQSELEAPLRVHAPVEGTEAEWMAFYQVCLKRWDTFCVDCNRSSYPQYWTTPARRAAKLLEIKIQASLAWLRQRGDLKLPLRSHIQCIPTTEATFVEAKRAYHEGLPEFLLNLVDSRYSNGYRLTRYYPASLNEFKKFCVDTRIAYALGT